MNVQTPEDVGGDLDASHDVFVSFKSDDKIFAERIYEVLEARGIRCWISSRDVPAGTNYQNQIRRAIRNCRVLLLIYSKNAQASTEIPNEIALAKQDKKVILPVQIDDVKPDDTFGYNLVTIQILDVHNNFDNNFDAHIERIFSEVLYHLPPRDGRGGRDQINSAGTVSLSPRQNFLPAQQTSALDDENTRMALGARDSPPQIGKYNNSEYLMAVARGREIRSAGGKKSDAARAIYDLLRGAPRRIVIDAFVEGANLTPAGASTYYQNIRSTN